MSTDRRDLPAVSENPAPVVAPADPLAPPRRAPAVPSARVCMLVAIGAGAGLAVLTIWTRHYGAGPTPLDSRIHEWIIVHRRPADVELARVVTWGGLTRIALPLLLVVGALAVSRGSGARRRLKAGIELAGMATLGVFLGHLLNSWDGRMRPPMHDWAARAGGPSFPSGHTTAATLFAASCAWVIAAQLKRGWPRRLVWAAAVVFAAAVGWSRAWLGVHWPTDVVGGWLFGTAWFALGTAVILATAKWLGRRSGTDAQEPDPVREPDPPRHRKDKSG